MLPEVGTAPWLWAGTLIGGGGGVARPPLGCSWGLGRRFLAAPRERHTVAWVPPGACQEAVCQGGAQMPSASTSAPNLLGPPVGGQPACLRLGSSIHHLLCPQSTDPESPGLWCPPPAPGLCPGSRCSGPWAPRYTPWEGWVGTGGWDPGQGRLTGSRRPACCPTWNNGAGCGLPS